MRIEHFEGLNRTPATVLAIQGWLELQERGLGEPVMNLNWDANVIAALADDGACIGVIVWQHIKWTRQVFVDLGYVAPAARQQGVYRALWAALVEKARELKVPHIYGITHLDNIDMRATARKLGRIEIGVSLRFDVPTDA
jgi:L-amino acid N-acyltransferase YncA